MADIIQLLPDHVANQIAAGEVVQRPSSVVKELLENAIDAQATVIKLIVKDAGKTLIQVIDNGVGMSVTDARLSFERHATSKIKAAEDLFNLNTKGFRGEALASIAAISHVELKTKQENQEVGTSIVIEGSKVISQDVIATPKGTSIAVKNLFFNIPARRNFLKSDTVEMRHVIDEFHRTALAHPTIQFSLYHNGNELFNLPESKYRQRIVNIFGNKTNEKLVPINEETEIVKISGFVGKPEFSKKTRGEQYFFVNNRFIKSGYLNHAVNAAFEGLVKDGYHPSFFIYLEVNPQTIDINIHPTKTEIKFDDEHALYAMLRATIKHSLGQFSIAPVLDFDRDANLDTPYEYQQKSVSTPTIEVDSSFNPFKEGSKAKTTSFNRPKPAQWESLYNGLENNDNPDVDFSNLKFESDAEAKTFFDVNTQQSTYQVFNKFIITSVKSGMLVIDQHRAHQRILYEEYLGNMTLKEATSQQLLFPLTLSYTPQELSLLSSIKEDLVHAGFVFKKFNEEAIEIVGIPVGVESSEVAIVLEQLISDVEHEVPDTHFSPADLLAKSLAKSLAIRTGTLLNKSEQEHIVNSLFACKEPTISPSNKPTYITLTLEQLDKKFV